MWGHAVYLLYKRLLFAFGYLGSSSIRSSFLIRLSVRKGRWVFWFLPQIYLANDYTYIHCLLCIYIHHFISIITWSSWTLWYTFDFKLPKHNMALKHFLSSSYIWTVAYLLVVLCLFYRFVVDYLPLVCSSCRWFRFICSDAYCWFFGSASFQFVCVLLPRRWCVCYWFGFGSLLLLVM